jgi:hypothetical protein
MLALIGGCLVACPATIEERPKMRSAVVSVAVRGIEGLLLAEEEETAAVDY